MKQIDSPRDLDALRHAGRAVVFIFFSWSNGSSQSLNVVTEWQRRLNVPGCQVFQLTPDHRAFSWQWLGTIFGEMSDERRTQGTVIWLREGSVAAIVRDAGAAGIKALDRITHDCFVLGKTLADGLVPNEPAPFDVELLKIL